MPTTDLLTVHCLSGWCMWRCCIYSSIELHHISFCSSYFMRGMIAVDFNNIIFLIQAHFSSYYMPSMQFTPLPFVYSNIVETSATALDPEGLY